MRSELLSAMAPCESRLLSVVSESWLVVVPKGIASHEETCRSWPGLSNVSCLCIASELKILNEPKGFRSGQPKQTKKNRNIN